MSKSKKKTSKEKIVKDEVDSSKRMTEWLSPDVKWYPRQIMLRKNAELNGWDWWKQRRNDRKYTSNKEWIEKEGKRMASKGIKTKVETKNITKGEVSRDYIALFME